MKVITKQDYRKRRHLRLRKIVRGSAERPRMCVFKSNTNMYVQFIDDDAGVTLASASTLAVAELRGANTLETATKLGAEAAKRALAVGISTAVFDRGGFNYGGKVRAIADGAREAGIKI